jgi:hypothetical protein
MFADKILGNSVVKLDFCTRILWMNTDLNKFICVYP